MNQFFSKFISVMTMFTSQTNSKHIDLKVKPYLKLSVFLIFVFFSKFTNGQYVVDFEGAGETKGSYASGTVNLSGIDWDMTEALIGTLANDFKNGDRSARLRGYGASSMTMLQNKPNGLGTISFLYRRYGTDNQVDWRVEYSTDAGGTWVQIGADFTAPANDDIQLFEETVNVCGDVRVRVVRATLDGLTNNRRLNIDDITITDCGGDEINIDGLSSLIYEVDCNNNDSGVLTFSTDGGFEAGNEFIVQLSNPVGDFTSPLDIGVLSGSTAEGANPAGDIDFTIPSEIAGGDGYRMRLLSTNPGAVSPNNGSDITITSEICPTALPASEGLLINEWTNGASGNKEYYEFIVAGKCGDIVDVRGYIIDDNNGTFTTDYTDPTGSGIAAGHMRLTNHSQWESIPVGSLIVVYNADDLNASLPPDDPYDSDGDSMYVIPHTNTDLFEITTSIPNAADPDSTYTPAVYNSDSWGPLGLANAQDAVQVRTPDGTYFHGVSYGGDVMSGGPNDMKIFNGSTTGMCGWFTSGDYLDANNWSVGDVSFETPGYPNNASNEEWLRAMRDPFSESCPVIVLPVTIADFSGAYNGRSNHLKWKTYTEQNNHYYNLYHSTNGKHFNLIGEIQGSGNSVVEMNYEFYHRQPAAGMNYYKLESVDYDGTVHQKGIIAIVVDIDYAFYDHITQSIQMTNKSDYSVYNSAGSMIFRIRDGNAIPISQKGIYMVIDELTGKATKVAVQ